MTETQLFVPYATEYCSTELTVYDWITALYVSAATTNRLNTRVDLIPET